MTQTLRELTGLVNPLPKNFPKALPRLVSVPHLLYGVELEIEGVGDAENWKVPGLHTERDGSLRNNGMEFITAPMTYSNLAYCLEMFFKKNPITKDNYSERTSIHVHTNCLPLTWEQVQSLCLVYQVLEKLLFLWVGEDRDKNIFCVPWHQTNLTYKTLSKSPDHTRFRNWQKYTALNLLPLYTQGTVEWRHMNGHCDVERILLWCRLINCIYGYVLSTSLEDIKKQLMQLNVSSEYGQILVTIFKDLSGTFLQMPRYEKYLEEGVLDTKYGLLGEATQAEKPVDMQEMMNFVQAQALAGRNPFVAVRAAPRDPGRAARVGGWAVIDDLVPAAPAAEQENV